VYGNGAIEIEDIKVVKFEVNNQLLKVYLGEGRDVRVIEVVYYDDA